MAKQKFLSCQECGKAVLFSKSFKHKCQACYQKAKKPIRRGS